MAITFSNIGGAEPSTVTFRAGTVVIARGSTNEQQEIVHLGDPQSSIGIAVVKAAAPVSTEFGLVVRLASGPSSAADLKAQVDPLSTGSTNPFPVRISDGSTWVVDYTQGSTFTSTGLAGGVNFLRAGASTVSSTDTLIAPWGSTVGHQIIAVTDSSQVVVYPGDAGNNALRITFPAGYVSSAAQSGNSSGLTVRPVWSSSGVDQPVRALFSSTKADNLVTVYQSTASELQATVTPAAGSTFNTRTFCSSAADFLATVTIGTNLQSSVAPSSGSSGLVVRQIIDNILTFASTSALASTTVEVQSSGASLRTYVVAYTITSTNQTPAQWGFFSSNGTLLWPVILAALSSATCGANLAVGAPAYLFRSAASDALNFKTAGSTVSGVQLGVSYFRAP